MDEPPSITLLIPILSLCVVGLLLMFSFFLAMAETACFSLSRGVIEQWSRSADDREKLVASLMADPLSMRIALMLVGVPARIFIVALGLLILSAAGLRNSATIEYILGITLVLIILSDVVPRTYARKYSVICARRLSAFLNIVVFICKPASTLIVVLRTKWKGSFKERKASREEMTQALEMAASTDTVVENEKEILRGIVNFGSLKVTDLMKKRSAISAINIDAPFDELINHINRCGYSRIPVYKNTLDTIVGVIYVKDLLPFLDEPQGFKWPSILRPGFFVTQSKKIDLLLKDFQEKRVHMGIVKDEAGKTSGLITLEDLIEEIIGEINDENDEIENEGYRKLDENTYVFDGRTPIQEFFKVLDHDLPFFSEPKHRESLEDFIFELHDELPTLGDELYYEQLTFVIEAIEQKRIKRVRVNVNAQA
ncbi:MAG: CNNM domain-containing protein [Chryseolinea sp.]